MNGRRLGYALAAVAIGVLLLLAGRSLAVSGSGPELGPPIVVDRGPPEPTGSAPSVSAPPSSTGSLGPTPAVTVPGARPVWPGSPPPAGRDGDDDGPDDDGDDDGSGDDGDD